MQAIDFSPPSSTPHRITLITSISRDQPCTSPAKLRVYSAFFGVCLFDKAPPPFQRRTRLLLPPLIYTTSWEFWNVAAFCYTLLNGFGPQLSWEFSRTNSPQHKNSLMGRPHRLVFSIYISAQVDAILVYVVYHFVFSVRP